MIPAIRLPGKPQSGAQASLALLLMDKGLKDK